VVAVRETIRWHPDPARRWAEAGLVEAPAFRRGAALLPRHGMALELLMNPYQAEAVARLAADLPDLVILVNHCGTPVDRDEAGIARWKHGLARMAAQPNVALKVSNFGAYSPDKSVPALRDTVMTCIDTFGVARVMFGSDYPVGRRAMSFAAAVDAFTQIIAGFSQAEQTALFYGNARRYYGWEAQG
jgi:predicted TIM-barrel fold metal-dependent hydrolase